MSKPLMPKQINEKEIVQGADIEINYINATKRLNLKLEVSKNK